MPRHVSPPDRARRRRREVRFAIVTLGLGIVLVGYVLRGVIEQRAPRRDQVDDRLERLELCLSIVYVPPGSPRVDKLRTVNDCPEYGTTPAPSRSVGASRPASVPGATTGAGTAAARTGRQESVATPSRRVAVSSAAPRRARPGPATTRTTARPAPASSTPARRGLLPGPVPSLVCGRLGLPLC